MRPNGLFYAGTSPVKRLRRAAQVIDAELAALCRQHWQQPQVATLRVPALSQIPLALPQRADYRDPAAR